MRKIEYYEKFINKLNEFLGVKLELKERGSEIEFIPEFNSKFIKKTFEQIGMTFLILESILEEYYEDGKDVYFTDLIEEFSQKLISHMTKGNLRIIEEQVGFIDNMKRICNETYESDNSNLNILLFRNNDNIEEELKNMGLDFLRFSSPKNMKEIFQEKLSLKMLNGDNLVLIVGEGFKGYGLGLNQTKETLFKNRMLIDLKKQNNNYLISYISFLSQNILSQLEETIETQKNRKGIKVDEEKLKKLTEYSNNKIASSKGLFKNQNQTEKQGKKPYVYLQIKNNEMRIYLQNSIDSYLFYKAGRWKLKSFRVLKFLILEKFYMDSFLYYLLSDEKRNKNNKEIITQYVFNIDVLVSLIKELLEDKKGGLFIILKRTLKGEEQNKIFVNRNESRSIYEKTVMKNSKITNLINHNFEYLKLISKVDGAVVLGNELELISFGRLVKLDVNKDEKRLEGARSAAAISGSKYGISIKVSEDGHITVWEDKVKVLEI